MMDNVIASHLSLWHIQYLAPSQAVFFLDLDFSETFPPTHISQYYLKQYCEVLCIKCTTKNKTCSSDLMDLWKYESLKIRNKPIGSRKQFE